MQLLTINLNQVCCLISPSSYVPNCMSCVANQKELVTDLKQKAKEIEYLIQSLPVPEPEEDQVHPV